MKTPSLLSLFALLAMLALAQPGPKPATPFGVPMGHCNDDCPCPGCTPCVNNRCSPPPR